MAIRLNTLALLLSAITLLITSANAEPVTYNFTGAVQQNNGGPTGQMLSGSLTIDRSTFQINSTDGLSYNQGTGTYYNASYCLGCGAVQASPLQVSGHQ